MVSLVSCSSKMSINMMLFSLDIFSNSLPSSRGLSQCTSLNLDLKYLYASSLTSKGFSTQVPSTSIPLTIFFLLLQFTIIWKNFELQFLSLSHLILDFCLRIYFYTLHFSKNLLVISSYLPTPLRTNPQSPPFCLIHSKPSQLQYFYGHSQSNFGSTPLVYSSTLSMSP